MFTLPINYNKLTRQERRLVRLQYISLQNNLCYWCKTNLDIPPVHTQWINTKLFPIGFFNYPIHLQHCHKTHMTEGAVHAYCNAVMWQYHGR